ncbi:hypothetical protein HC891_14350 [Candidatus Gracilibacteria bacterium]|nr:hypothetical protein [Candidatus Gracilibacteria bacterium]
MSLRYCASVHNPWRGSRSSSVISLGQTIRRSGAATSIAIARLLRYVARCPFSIDLFLVNSNELHFTYDCNPHSCLCGFAGDVERQCSCSQGLVTHYAAQVSGQLLDRIDLQYRASGIGKRIVQNIHRSYGSSLCRE